QVLRLLAEVILRSRLEPIHSMSKEDLVRIHREDLLLRKAPLDRHRQHRFMEFAAEVSLRVQKQVARQLHRQRRSALRATPRRDIAISGSKHTPPIDAPMLFK